MVAVAAEAPIRADAVPAAAAAAVPGERPEAAAARAGSDAPVFVSPAIDFYSHHPVQPPPMQVVPVVVGGGGGGGLDSSSDGSTNGQPNRRRRGSFNQGRRRMGGRPRRTDREDSVRRTVYVSDIDQHVTEQKLAEVFSNCGQVVDCRICGDPNSVLRFAFIEFADDVGARAALTLGGTVLGYYPVRVLPSKTAILPVNPKFLPRTEDEKEMVSRTVYCTNIDKNVPEDAVKSFFEGMCGEVARLRLLGDYVHSTCIAFVEFVQADSAILALSCSGMVLGALPGEPVKDTGSSPFAPCDVALKPGLHLKPSSRAAILGSNSGQQSLSSLWP
uniref:RRM domain-containing protein n=1 Tax=Leersia perrieri TaxID=77586 RepID=A0A0D9WR02_9ORYZ